MTGVLICGKPAGAPGGGGTFSAWGGTNGDAEGAVWGGGFLGGALLMNGAAGATG